jgi:hypothetical protein
LIWAASEKDVVRMRLVVMLVSMMFLRVARSAAWSLWPARRRFLYVLVARRTFLLAFGARIRLLVALVSMVFLTVAWSAAWSLLPARREFLYVPVARRRLMVVPASMESL